MPNITSFIHEQGDSYIVTGVTTDGKKFRLQYSNPRYALGINLWRGNVWQLRNGKRRLLKQVTN